MTEATQIPFAQLGYELMTLLITEDRVARKLAEFLPQGIQPLPESVEALVQYEGQYRIERVRAQQIARAGEDCLRFRIAIRLRLQLSLLLLAFEEQYEISAEPHFDLEMTVHRPLTLRFTAGPVRPDTIPIEVCPIGNLFSFAQGHLEEYGPEWLAGQINELIQAHSQEIEFDLLPLLQQTDTASSPAHDVNF